MIRGLVVAAIVVVLLAAHAVLLPYALRSIGVSAAVVSAVVILIAIKHIGPPRRPFRRRPRH